MNTKFLLSLALLISTTAYTANANQQVQYEVNDTLPSTASEILESGKKVSLRRMSPVPRATPTDQSCFSEEEMFLLEFLLLIVQRGCATSCAHKADNCASTCSHGGPVGDMEDLLKEKKDKK